MEKELVIPVYLNQKIVFDLLAIYEDGFSQMRSITKQESLEKNKDNSVEGEIGISNVFSFLGVKLSGGLKRGSTKKNDKTTNEEKVHTPTSLFSKLLSYLNENKIIKSIIDNKNLQDIKSGDFLLFKGTLMMNPLIKVFEAFSKMMELVVIFNDKFQQQGKGQKHLKNPNTKIVSQIKSLTESLKLGGMIDLICNIGSGVEAIIQAEIDYFSNKNITQIEEGEYQVLGKVVKVSNAETPEPINLLRNTSLSLAKKSFMNLMFTQLESPEIRNAGFEIPEIKTNIENAVLVIPISIYA